MANQESSRDAKSPGSTDPSLTPSSDDSEVRRREMEIFRSMLSTTLPMAPDPDDPTEEPPSGRPAP